MNWPVYASVVSESGWRFGTCFFHFIWDAVLSIDFHIFQDGENHQPGMFPYFSDDEVAVDAHGQMVRPPEDLVPWVIKPISPSWVVDIYIYIYT